MLVKTSDYTTTDSGTGYVIGEINGTHPTLDYLAKGCIVTLFDGLDTALDYITTKMPKPLRGDSSLSTDRDGFNAFANYDEAMSTFRNNPEKVTKFDGAELRIKDESESGSNVDYDVTGDYIDMGRYMEGVPESFGTMHNGNARNRRVNVMLSLNQYSSIDHTAISHRGERILRLVDALEGGGIRTMLTGVESTQTNHFEVIVKRHDEPLTISDLAVISHPEFLRRAIFRIIEHSKTFSYGYGQAMPFGRSATPEVLDSGNVNELDIFIDGNISDIKTIDKLFDQIEKLLVWEMSKPVPEVTSMKLDRNGIYFNPNGVRSDSEIQREGQDIINNG